MGVAERTGYAAAAIVRELRDPNVRVVTAYADRVADGVALWLRIDGGQRRVLLKACDLIATDSMCAAVARAIDDAVSDARMVVHVDRDPGDEHAEAA